MIHRRRTEYKKDGSSYSSLMPHTKTQEQLELDPVDYNRATRVPQNRAKQDTIIPSQTAVAHSLSLFIQIPTLPLLDQFSSLCQRQFQSEPWHLDNMRFAMAAMTGVACLFLNVFATGQSKSFDGFVVVLAAFVAGLVCLVLIPLC